MISSFIRHVSWPGFLLGVGTALVVDRWGRGAAVKIVSAGMDVRNEGKAIFDAARVEAEKIRAEAALQHAQQQYARTHAAPPPSPRSVAQIKAEIAALQREVEGLEKEPAAHTHAHKHPGAS